MKASTRFFRFFHFSVLFLIGFNLCIYGSDRNERTPQDLERRFDEIYLIVLGKDPSLLSKDEKRKMVLMMTKMLSGAKADQKNESVREDAYGCSSPTEECLDCISQRVDTLIDSIPEEKLQALYKAQKERKKAIKLLKLKRDIILCAFAVVVHEENNKQDLRTVKAKA